MKHKLGFFNAALAVILLISALGVIPAHAAEVNSSGLMINELDADQASTDTAEFIELYDGGTGNTSLDGFVLVFYNGSNDLSYAAFDLDGKSTDAGGYFVLCGNTTNVPNCDWDVSPDSDLIQNGQDAAALYVGDASSFPTNTPVTTVGLLDAIVYDTSDADDPGLLVLLNPGQPQVDENGGGSGTTHSNQRCPNGSGGLRNTSTYIQALPSAGITNTCPALDTAPEVTSTTPLDGAKAVALDATISVTFSEAVSLTEPWFDITCTYSGSHTAVAADTDPVFTLTPDTPFWTDDVCTVTVTAANVSDEDGIEPLTMAADHVFSFDTIKSPKINEYSANTTGDDVEYVEIIGSPGTDYSAFSVLVIEGDSGTSLGLIDRVIAVGTTDANGLYLASLTNGNLENGTLSLLLVEDNTGIVGNDIDTNNDGTIDTTYWTAISDSVSPNDGGTGDLSYGLPVLLPNYDGFAYAPGGASRIPDGTDTETDDDWVRNDFDLAGIPGYPGTIVVGEAYNTPGAFNAVYVEAAPTVASTVPLDGALDFPNNNDIVITFSEKVTVTDTWFNITCATSGAHTAMVTDTDPVFTLNPDTNFTAGETCTVTVYAASVKDDDTDDSLYDTMVSDYSFSFTAITPPEKCGDPYIPIYTIQGSGLSSAYDDLETVTEGIVVGDFQTTAGDSGQMNGFFIQDPTGDGDATTSDAIMVYSNTEVQMGDKVRVRGVINEYITMTEFASGIKLWICATGLTPPMPIVIDLPAASPDALEAYEGMLVTIPEVLTVQQNYFQGRYGQLTLGSDGRIMNTNNVAIESYAGNISRMVVLDDGVSLQNQNPIPYYPVDGALRAGDTVSNLVGVLDQGRINSNTSTDPATFIFPNVYYRLQPTQAPLFTQANPRVLPGEPAGDLTVTSFNVLNYFTTLDVTPYPIDSPYGGDNTPRGADSATEFTRQQAKLIAAAAIMNADIFGLVEIEAWDGAAAVSAFTTALNTAIGGDPVYDFIADPVTGVGGDAIQQALIYKTASVTPIGGALSLSVAPFDLYRYPIAQLFEDNGTGEQFWVIVNHFKSKNCGVPNYTGDEDLGDGIGCYNATRVVMAEGLMAWINGTLALTDSDVLVIGDLNSYGGEDPITTLTDAGMIDQIAENITNATDRYTYVFDGMAGYLDHALTTESLDEAVKDVIIWHINADEPSIIDYNTEFKGVPTYGPDLYQPHAFRSSDHDPVMIYLSMPVYNLFYFPVVFN